MFFWWPMVRMLSECLEWMASYAMHSSPWSLQQWLWHMCTSDSCHLLWRQCMLNVWERKVFEGHIHGTLLSFTVLKWPRTCTTEVLFYSWFWSVLADTNPGPAHCFVCACVTKDFSVMWCLWIWYWLLHECHYNQVWFVGLFQREILLERGQVRLQQNLASRNKHREEIAFGMASGPEAEKFKWGMESYQNKAIPTSLYLFT